MKYWPLIEPWLEPKYKLIAQPPPPVSDYDPGDTAQREGMFMFGAFLLYHLELMDDKEVLFIQDRYEKVLDLLNDPNHPGFLRRYPDPAYWGGQSDRFSRDQSIPNVIAMAYCSTMKRRNPSKHLWNFFKDHLKRGLLFTTNTRKNWAPNDSKKKLPDLTIGSFHALYIRSFRAKWAYPLLWLLDIDLLGGSIAKLFYAMNPSNNDDLNHILCMYQAELTMPTLWSKLAMWIYKFRKFPSNSGDAKNPAQACMNAYFRGNNPGPKLEQVYQEINEHFFGK